MIHYPLIDPLTYVTAAPDPTPPFEPRVINYDLISWNVSEPYGDFVLAPDGGDSDEFRCTMSFWANIGPAGNYSPKTACVIGYTTFPGPIETNTLTSIGEPGTYTTEQNTPIVQVNVRRRQLLGNFAPGTRAAWTVRHIKTPGGNIYMDFTMTLDLGSPGVPEIPPSLTVRDVFANPDIPPILDVINYAVSYSGNTITLSGTIVNPTSPTIEPDVVSSFPMSTAFDTVISAWNPDYEEP